MPAEREAELLARINELQQRLEVADQTLAALRNREIDAIVVSGPGGDSIYTLNGADEAYRLMVQNMAEGALTVTPDGLILFSNKQFTDLLGIPPEHVIGSLLVDFVAPEDAPVLSAELECSSAQKVEIRLRKWPETFVPVRFTASTLLVDATECVCLIVTDLSEQKRYEAEQKESELRVNALNRDLERQLGKLERTSAQKDLLLREVQHRVKNNLQVISSILSLEGRRFPEGEFQKVLCNNRDRIRSMALIHDKFCYTEHLARIDFGDYIQSLASYFMSAHASDQSAIQLSVEVNLELDMDHAIPLGLIVQELLSNSVKHAFVNGPGEIRIEARHSLDELLFIYHDSGPGLPAAVDLHDPESLGLQLVGDLVHQLQGKMDYQSSNGSTFTMRFNPELIQPHPLSAAAQA